MSSFDNPLDSQVTKSEQICRSGARIDRCQPSVSLRAHEVDLYVGGRIRLRRQAVGITQRQLAEALGITFQQQYKIELGLNRVSLERLAKIASTLRVPASWFFEGFGRSDNEAQLGMRGMSASFLQSLPFISVDGLEALCVILRLLNDKGFH